MGITEPAIFGVNVRFGKPLVAGMAGGACGAAVASIMNVYATANGVTGIFGFLITTDSFLGYLLTFAVAAVVAFVLSWILYAPTKEKVPDKEYKDNCVYSPMNGRAIALEEVPDKTFASGTLGQGAAIDPMDGKVVAPADGKVSTLFDSHHAVGLTLDNGMELFVHIGMNTVELGGEGFDAYVKEGDRVSRGDTLITFDIQTLKNKGYSVISPVIITNAEDFKEIRRTADGGINYYEELLETKK